MNERQVVVVGGGERVFLRPSLARRLSPEAGSPCSRKARSFLSKVRISGGGRCNVTYACFDGRELSSIILVAGQRCWGRSNIFNRGTHRLV